MPGLRSIQERPIRGWARSACIVVLAAIPFCTAAALPRAAAAATDTLALSAGPANPNGLTPITITASGSTSIANELLIVSVDPAAAGCPSSYTNAPGGFWIDQFETTAGSFTAHSGARTLEHGTYDVCGWLIKQSEPPTVLYEAQPKRLVVANDDSLGLAMSPARLTDGGSATLAIHGVSDVDRPEVFVTEKPASKAGCGTSPAADHGMPLPEYDPALVTFGRYSDSASESPGAMPGGRADGLAPGRYKLCGWLIDANGSSIVPLAPVASATLTLVAPSGTLAYSVPELVSAGKPFAITANVDTGASDVRLYLDLKRLPSKGPLCAASHALEPRSARLIVNGGRAAKTTIHSSLPHSGVYIACAWLEWPHGTIDGPFAGRIVVAGHDQHPVQYLGITSQRLRRKQLQSNYPISFETIDGQIVNMSYFARFTCTERGKRATHPIYSTTFPAFAIAARYKFLDSFVQGSDHALIGGRVAGTRARGTFSESYLSGGYRCSSGTVAFSARRA
jgi:hypothetical protein